MTPVEIGIIIGVVWASFLVVWALAEMTTGEPNPLLILIMQIYDGFDFTPKGVLIGGFWAFADGFITGYVICTICSWIF